MMDKNTPALSSELSKALSILHDPGTSPSAQSCLPSFLSQVLLSNKRLTSKPLSQYQLLDHPIVDTYTNLYLSLFIQIQYRLYDSAWL